MKPRKPHSKSRLGCAECKRRHTKCDEVHPTCSSCQRLKVQCNWPTPPRSAGGSISSPDSSVRTPGTPETPSVINNFINITTGSKDSVSEKLALVDLKLLHHFTAKTYATLDTVTLQRGIWQESIIELGFRYPFLLRGVLAVSALHMASLNPPAKVEFLVQAATQYNRGLLDFRNVLNSVDKDNCGAVFLFSSLTVVHAFAVAQLQKPLDPLADLLNCMHLIQGVNTILQPHWLAIMATDLRPLLLNGMPRGIAGEIPEVLQLKNLVDSMPDLANTPMADKYKEAISSLHGVLVELKSSGDEQSFLSLLLSWPAVVNPEFLNALAMNHSVALIIVAHFACVLQRRCWWIARWNEYTINAVEERLDPSLHDWLAWPRKISNLSGGCETQ